MKIEEIEISGIKYSFEVFDDSTDLIVKESFIVPSSKVGYATTRINHDFIPVAEVKDSFAPENRWY